MFQLETPILELMLRGAFLFILFMVLFRLLPRRTGGELAPMDLVFLLLITEAASNMAEKRPATKSCRAGAPWR